MPVSSCYSTHQAIEVWVDRSRTCSCADTVNYWNKYSSTSGVLPKQSHFLHSPLCPKLDSQSCTAKWCEGRSVRCLCMCVCVCVCSLCAFILTMCGMSFPLLSYIYDLSPWIDIFTLCYVLCVKDEKNIIVFVRYILNICFCGSLHVCGWKKWRKVECLYVPLYSWEERTNWSSLKEHCLLPSMLHCLPLLHSRFIYRILLEDVLSCPTAPLIVKQIFIIFHNENDL